MEKDFVRIPREVKTRLERIEIESRGLQEENAELKAVSHLLQTELSRVNLELTYWKSKALKAGLNR